MFARARQRERESVGRDVARRSRGNNARDDHDLKTSRWQEDKVYETVGLDDTSTQNERVAGTVAVKREEQRGPASPPTAQKDKGQDENKIQSDQNSSNVHRQATRGRQNHIGTTTLRERGHVA